LIRNSSGRDFPLPPAPTPALKIRRTSPADNVVSKDEPGLTAMASRVSLPSFTLCAGSAPVSAGPPGRPKRARTTAVSPRTQRGASGTMPAAETAATSITHTCRVCTEYLLQASPARSPLCHFPQAVSSPAARGSRRAAACCITRTPMIAVEFRIFDFYAPLLARKP
jgi:hypothetical protein